MTKILSVGIDIGTSTTQVIFSRIAMENTAGYFAAPRIAVVEKELIYQSPVHLTPLKTEILLDGDKIRDLVAEEFFRAGFSPADVDTGAVIITGESARKENAAIVLEKLSSFAGEFVVSTAGPDLESIVAGKGSGAYQYSMDYDCTVLNLDVGGGTSNLVLFDGGEAVGKSCWDIGGRLIRLDRDFRLQYISPAARIIGDALGISLNAGERTSEKELRRITDFMAKLLSEAAGFLPADPVLERIRTPNSSEMKWQGRARKVCFSGGVAACMGNSYENMLEYGDIGKYLAESIEKCPYFPENSRISASQTIRATVVGAGTYTTSLSGSTITYDSQVFPRKNLPALKLTLREEESCLRGDTKELTERLKWFLEQNDSQSMLLALRGPADPAYEELKTLARCIMVAMDQALPPEEPVIAVVEQDIAKALGGAMRQVPGISRKIAAVDSIKIEAGDYVDIGRPLMDGLVVPVVVKTLLFG